MKIEITSINVDNKCQDLIVCFMTAFGSGSGIWIGTPPKIANQYEVELDIEDVLIWNDTIKETKDKNVVISYDDQGMMLQGKVERLDSDGIVYVRLHSSLIMIETDARKPSLPETFVSIRPERILLYPHDVY